MHTPIERKDIPLVERRKGGALVVWHHLIWLIFSSISKLMVLG